MKDAMFCMSLLLLQNSGEDLRLHQNAGGDGREICGENKTGSLYFGTSLASICHGENKTGSPRNPMERK
ncbi:hypothetical protein A7K69_14905 [Parageobacillus thermoglucosidasius]|uniref:Uncharacterized protein n=1 Tax=Parageobacillus thermoglucosidasius TaxID=1426 RepID=A0A1B7KN06_PARTM|nr:hypothetical protein A7K69_14905 [Parageobacillus thermoglucosidasius]